MELKGYDIEKNPGIFTYEFYSVGPLGKIRKRVEFQPMKNTGRNVYNLAFGDVNETTGRINDRSTSNNRDKALILNTIGIIIIEFMEERPNAILLIQGTSESRIRLYQMAISSFWSVIAWHFDIYGERKAKWSFFEKGINYERFLVYRKIN